jgi:hypothetical protein
MKPCPPGGNPESFGEITKPVALSVKIAVPRGVSTPLALIELTVAVAVAAVAGVPAKRKLATNILKIAFKKSRMLAPSPSSTRLLGVIRNFRCDSNLDWHRHRAASKRKVRVRFEAHLFVPSASEITTRRPSSDSLETGTGSSNSVRSANESQI